MTFPEEYIADELSRGNLELLTVLYDLHVLTNNSRLRILGRAPQGQSILSSIADGQPGQEDLTDERFNRLKSCVDFLLEHGYNVNSPETGGGPLLAAIYSHQPRLALYLIEKGVEAQPFHLFIAHQQFEANLDNPYSRQLLARLTTERVRQNIPGAATARTARRAFQTRTGINIASPAGRTFMQMLGGPQVQRFGPAGAHLRRTRRRR